VTTNARRAFTSVLFIMASVLFWLAGFMLNDSIKQYTLAAMPAGEFLVPVILFLAGIPIVKIIICNLVPGLTENPGRHTHTILRVGFFAAFLLVLCSSFLF
jgi:hypothetical protein